MPRDVELLSFVDVTTNELSEAAKAVVRRNTEEVQSKGNFELFEELFSDDFLVLLDLVLMGEKNRTIREHIYSVARTHRPAVEEAWVEVLQRSGLERAQAETVLWLTLSVVRGLAIRSLWQPDPKRFRGLLDEWKALMSERLAGRSRSGLMTARFSLILAARRLFIICGLSEIFPAKLIVV